MANREITYYSLLSSANLRHIEQVADTMDEQSFVTLGFDQKWLWHLWIWANNEFFLEHISLQTDLTKLDMILGEQLKLYARKQGEGFEQDKGDFYGTYKARKDWLNHTIFICRNEYNKTRNEVFNEVVNWCIDWQKEWLETFNPYSPTERKELGKDLKTPLWEQLNEGEPPQPIIENHFSVLEWATIFYYADETKLLPESRTIKTRIEQFIKKHKIDTTFNNFKKQYYKAKERINKLNNYPIKKLELIIPFLKKNYKQTVSKVDNDIFILKEEEKERDY